MIWEKTDSVWYIIHLTFIVLQWFTEFTKFRGLWGIHGVPSNINDEVILKNLNTDGKYANYIEIINKYKRNTTKMKLLEHDFLHLA